MRILVISDYRSELSSRPEAEMFLAMAGLPGYTVDIMTYPEGTYVERFREQRLKVIPFHPKTKWSKKETAILRLQLIEGAYDILHVFNSKALMHGLRAARKLPVKVIGYRGFLGHVHWYDPSSYFKYLHPRLDVTVCITREIQRDLDRQFICRKPRTVWIPKGHHPDWYQDVAPADLGKLGLPEDAFPVICVANNRPFKDIPTLLRAAALVPESCKVHWVLVGHGMATRENLRLAARVGAGRQVHFLSFRSDTLQLMKACKVVALSSRSGEGLNKTVIEGQFLGLPAVVTDLGGNREIVEDGKTGFIVPSGDPQAFAAAVVKLASDAELLKRMKQDASTRVRERLHIDRTIQEMTGLYARLLNQQSL